jgi:uncharacterized membrane protein YbhN (UPF0104 family)
MRRLASFLAKAAISALLLYLSVHRVNFGSVGERLGTLNFGWLVFMLIALCVQTLLLALRWREIVGICGAQLHLTAGLSYSFNRLVFSQVLPSTIGGDAARIWLMARGGAGWPMASYSVLLDRVVGVTVLAILVVVCLPWTLDLIHDPVASATLAMIGFGTLAGAMGFLTRRAVLARHGKVVAHPPTRCRLALGLAAVSIGPRRHPGRGVVIGDARDCGNCGRQMSASVFHPSSGRPDCVAGHVRWGIGAGRRG